MKEVLLKKPIDALLLKKLPAFEGNILPWTQPVSVRLRLKCDGTRAKTRFRLSAKGKSPFKSAGASVQSTTGSRVVRISGSNAGYTMFRGSVKNTGQFPLHFPAVRHRVPSHFSWTLHL